MGTGDGSVSIHELAKVLDGKVSRRTLFNFLKGKGNPTLRVLEWICAALDLDVVIRPQAHFNSVPRIRELRHWREKVIEYDRRKRLNRRRN
jgi:transcriptional regulator with XRE-family HTH domain